MSEPKSFQLLKSPRPHGDVLHDWAPELSKKLGRPVDDIRRSGLTAEDFSIADTVEVRHPDGSKAAFRFAFSLVRPRQCEAAVFSEHDGYLEFALVKDAVVADIHELIYRQE